ncbi:MAG: hypothetical protein ABIK84_06315 [candidate division WOR-3 bacterium]
MLENINELIENLRNIGFVHRKDFGEQVQNIAYRIMEKTRIGKRDEVFYLLLRTFNANQKQFPKLLVEPFKPNYDDGTFKSCIYAFLSGVLGGEE